MAVTTSYYNSTWHGSFDGTTEDLTVLLSRATDVINNAIFLSGYTVDTTPSEHTDRISKAVCAQVDYIDNMGGKNSMGIGDTGSMSLGKFSYSSGSNVSSGTACELCVQARDYLLFTGLLYRGVAVL